jgi:KUP system potassium uptake protein
MAHTERNLQTTSLGNAYGVCVIVVTMITTCMVSLVAIVIWRIPLQAALLFFLFFGALDGAYMSSALRKVPEGAWFTVVLALTLSSIFILWRWGKEQQWAAEAGDRFKPSQLLREQPGPPTSDGQVEARDSAQLALAPEFGGGDISTAAGLGVFFDKVGGNSNEIPKVFVQFIRKFNARPQVIVFFHMRPLSVPTVPADLRFVITRVTGNIPSCYRLTLRHGYMDDVLTPDLGGEIVSKLMLFITRGAASDPVFNLDELPHRVREEVLALKKAQSAQMVYLIGKQVMRVRRSSGNVKELTRRIGLEVFLWIRENSRAKLADLAINPDNLIEVGFVKEV